MQNELITLQQELDNLRENFFMYQSKLESLKIFFEQAVEEQDLRIRNLRNEQ